MNQYLARPIVGITYSARDLQDFSLWRHIFHGFVAVGATPLAIDCTYVQPEIETVVAGLDGIVISGGGDVDPGLYGGDRDDSALRGLNPTRDLNERRALDRALEQCTPILAICRGFQFVNVALGGTLHADLARDRPGVVAHRDSEDALARPLHDVDVLPGTLLSSWIGAQGTVPVNSQHHQGIDRLAADLSPAAYSVDGLVEAAELVGRRLVAVQWHPEILWPNEPHAEALLGGFVEECRARAVEREKVQQRV